MIYLSIWKTDHYGTLTCLKCGETEDARFGINKNGKLLTKYKPGGYPGGLFNNYINEKFEQNEAKNL